MDCSYQQTLVDLLQVSIAEGERTRSRHPGSPARRVAAQDTEATLPSFDGRKYPSRHMCARSLCAIKNNYEYVAGDRVASPSVARSTVGAPDWSGHRTLKPQCLLSPGANTHGDIGALVVCVERNATSKRRGSEPESCCGAHLVHRLMAILHAPWMIRVQGYSIPFGRESGTPSWHDDHHRW